MAAVQRPISETFAQAVANSVAAADPLSSSPPGAGESKMSQRPVSEMITPSDSFRSAEADAIDKWVDDLAQYEETMEAMAKASLDQNFKDELGAIEQWFQVLSDPERTATLFSLLQHTNRVQQGFFIAFLQQLSRKDNRGTSDKGKEAKKAADAGRARRLSSKPNLPGLANTNEKYAQMYSAEDPSYLSPTRATPVGNGMTINTQAYKNAPPRAASAAPLASVFASRPRSAATPNGMFPVQDKWAFGNPVDPTMRPRSVMDPQAFEEPTIRPGSTSIEAIMQANGMHGPPSASKWVPSTPTYSSFNEMARAIERPNSTSELERPMFSAGPRGPSKLSGAVRSPLGPVAGESGFMAGARTRMTIATAAAPRYTQTPPLSADPNRRVQSPAFPPGLHPTNTWGSSSSPAPVEKKSTPAPAAAKKYAMGESVVAKDAARASPTLSGVDKNKAVEPIDFKLLNDIPGWFRSMRLHKYTTLFESMRWQDIINMTDEQLTDKGVAALGARRKMIKVFEQVKAEAADANVSLL